LKVDGRDPQNWEKNAPAGRFTCMELGSHISVKMLTSWQPKLQQASELVINKIKIKKDNHLST
jgi:hypothetical protein